MSKWTGKDVIKVFADQKSIERMYRYRFMAFTITMLAKGDKLKDINSESPSKEDLQSAINGCKDFLRYDELVNEDAAVYSTLHSKKTDKGLDLKSLNAAIDGKEIDKKFVQNAEKSNPTYQKDLEYLNKIKDAAETSAKKIIKNGEKIELDDFNKKIITDTLGKEYADDLFAAKSKYGTWSKVNDTGAVSEFAGTDKGSKFLGGGVPAVKQELKDTATKAYDTVMKSETNFLSAPVKLLFFGIHELLNVNSVFRKDLRATIDDIKKIFSNKQAIDEYKKLGIEGLEWTDSTEESTKKSYTNSIKEIQRELIKGYDLQNDLKSLGYDEKKTKNESWIREAEEVDQADVGEDEESESDNRETVQSQNQLDDEELTKLQNIAVEIIQRYNCLIYFMMRSFAGTYGHNKEFAQFSFHPFTITDNKEQEKEWKKEDFEKIKNFFTSEEGKKYGVKDLNSVKNLQSDKKEAIYNALIAKNISGDAIDKVLGTSDGIAESFIFADYIQNMLLEANKKVIDPYVLTLSKGVDHWIKNDLIMSRLIQRNQKLKAEIQKNSKFSTFFAYAKLFEDFLNEYRTCIEAIESNPNFDKIKNVDIKLTGIKNLKLIECTANLQRNLAYLSNHTNGNLKSEVRREFIALSMFKKITNITNFLTIRNMDLKNMKAFIDMVLPKMEMLRRPTTVSCTLSRDVASTVFGEKGIPYSVLNQSMDEDKEKAKKLYTEV